MISRREFLAGSTMIAGVCAYRHARGLNQERRDQGDMKSLVPSSIGETADYFCTWHTQYYLASSRFQANDMSKMMGAEGSKLARAELTEANLLGPNGMAETFYPSLRHDLMFVLDDGWDVPPDGNLSVVGSQEIDTQRFPSLKGTPSERLVQLNQAFQKKGWRSAGLWIAAQIAPSVLERDRSAGKDTASESYLQNYWKERLNWSHAAGIRYWKVDWGKSANDVAFRQMLSSLAKELAPSLTLEATLPCGPLNQPLSVSAEGETVGRVDPGWVRRSLPLLHLPGTFRIYDTLPFLSVATSLDRIAALLRAAEGTSSATAVLNSEEEVYLGAVLGCNVGVMRHPIRSGSTDAQDQDPRHLARRLTEVQRAICWHRIAPPTSVSTGTVTIDDRILWDSWEFKPGQTWLSSVIGKEIRQGAPARIARGLPLPEVRIAGEPPYVVASKHPNGSLAIATIGRMSPNGWSIPLADITLEGGMPGQKVGIFGRYRSLAIHFNHLLNGRTLIAQDIAADHATNITRRVTIEGSLLRIEGSLIDDLAASTAARADGSEPGIVLLVI